MLTFKEFITESRFDAEDVSNPSFNDLTGILKNSQYKHVKFIVHQGKITAATGRNCVHWDLLPNEVKTKMSKDDCDKATPHYPHLRGEIYQGGVTNTLYGRLYSRGKKEEGIDASPDHPIVQKMKKMGVKVMPSPIHGISSS